jgi:hypothetical protein
MISLERLLTESESRVDFIDFDIQGTELPAIEAAIVPMTRTVRRALVATHGPEIDEGCPRCFARWYATALHRCGETASIVDAAQCWVNPNAPTN